MNLPDELQYAALKAHLANAESTLVEQAAVIVEQGKRINALAAELAEARKLTKRLCANDREGHFPSELWDPVKASTATSVAP